MSLCAAAVPEPSSARPNAALVALVEADWAAQEKLRGCTPGDEQSLGEALARGDRLLRHLSPIRGAAELSDWARQWATLRDRARHLEDLGPEDRLRLYHEVRWSGRQLALEHPQLAGHPLVFLKRHRFICQMLHEYLGYYYDYGDIAGGGIYVLEQPGQSLATRNLIGEGLGHGNYTTLALAFDARTIYFAFAERAPRKPGFYSPERRCFHLYAVDPDGGNLRRLTSGPEDDFDPCPLPDGAVAFMSTRRGGFGRCHNPWEPLPSYTLHRLEADGQGIRTLSWHETNEWHPWVSPDGRVVYSRWDYVDRSAANFHGLWISNPDGSAPSILFGNYTTRVNACFQPRSIPGSDRILFVAGAHHADVGGSLVLLDPSQVALDPETGEDRLEAIEVLTPDVCFPEAPGWPKTYFHSPWPLSEEAYLVSFSFDPLPGMGPGEKRDTRTGLYYFDRFGNLEVLYRDPEISSMYPIPLAPRPRPPVLPSSLDPSLGDTGVFILTDVRRSRLPPPPGRAIRELRVFQVLPKTETHVANQPRIGHANAESARMLLGSVPVHPDGSACFQVPARKPVYFQAVDDQGRAVQSMRSITYLQPGERRGCVGCHEPAGEVTAARPLEALAGAPSTLEAGPDGSRPFSFPRLVQPVLDAHCVRCHDGVAGAGKSPPDLTGAPTETFTVSYDSLKPYVRWHEWGDASISQTVTRPGHGGADASPLTRILEDAVHAAIGLPESDRRRLYLWLDANVPFYGTYGREERLAQRSGGAVDPPRVQ